MLKGLGARPDGAKDARLGRLPLQRDTRSIGTVKRVAVCAILLLMPMRSSALPQAARPLTSFSLADQPEVHAALDWFPKNLKWINDEQATLTEIPAPSFEEEKRAAAVKAVLTADGLPVHIDKIGNVIAELRGANDKECILLTAHLDTVFPAGTE